MIDLIEQRRAELADLCRKYRVKTLEVFGSAADGTWDPLTSDVDFLVEFLPLAPGELFKFFFDLNDELRHLFRRKIDLVMPGNMENPYFQKSVNESRQVVYAA